MKDGLPNCTELLNYDWLQRQLFLPSEASLLSVMRASSALRWGRPARNKKLPHKLAQCGSSLSKYSQQAPALSFIALIVGYGLLLQKDVQIDPPVAVIKNKCMHCRLIHHSVGAHYSPGLLTWHRQSLQTGRWCQVLPSGQAKPFLGCLPELSSDFFCTFW